MPIELVTAKKRTNKRSRLLVKAVLRVRGTESEVRIRDISTFGALLETEYPPASGEDVFLAHGDLDSRCRVIWVDGQRFGVEFHHPIEPGDVLPELSTPLRVSAPLSYRRPRLEAEEQQQRPLRLVRK